jgi:phosphatidylserine/phosphatidylglycerophosphate/cardiolipin synthase-like enzyme
MKYQLYQGKEIIKLSREDYYYFLIDELKNAKKRIFAVIFIVDLLNDPTGKVIRILEEFSYAVWRGLEVKLIVGHSNNSFEIDMCGRAIKKYGDMIGIPSKFAKHDTEERIPAKHIIIDDNLIVYGSHNWTTQDIFKNREESFAILSRDTVIALSKEFKKLWDLGLEAIK